MIKTLSVVLIISLACAAVALAQPVVPLGSQFQINTYTTGGQYRPATAVDTGGAFVVVWSSDGSDDSDTDKRSILGQRYTSDGSSVDGEFQVNTYTTGYQRYAAAARASDGAFVVVWESGGMSGGPGPDGDGFGIAGRRYGAGGAPIGDEFVVNNHTPSRQSHPEVAMRANGGFVVTWESYGSPGDDDSQGSIQARRYAANGSPGGNQFQVNTYTTWDQEEPAVGINPDGEVVVVWESQGSTEPDTFKCIMGQRFASNGARIGGEFQVSSYPGFTVQPGRPAVAVAPGGQFLAVWQSNESTGTDQDGNSIQAQLYASNGTRIGGEFQVNSITNGDQSVPEAAYTSDNFIVVWQSSWGIEGQRFTSDGAPIGDEFEISSYATAFSHWYPSLAADADGRLVVTWSSDQSPGSDIYWLSIQGQRMAVPIFADGFESGDTSAWSATVGGP
ncbi:MAG: hypothetical protein GY856_26735 [bacterium]|nr:hypothetical protein [bacterium]